MRLILCYRPEVPTPWDKARQALAEPAEPFIMLNRDRAIRPRCYSTVMVICSEAMGGSWGIWLQSPKSSCKVCAPGASSMVV